MAKDYVFTPPPNWPPPPRGWVPPPGWTPDPEWGPAPEGWEFWTLPEGGQSWFAQHTVLTGVAATALVIGGVVGISAFASGGSGDAAPAALTSSSPTLLTALDATSDEPTTDGSLSPSTEEPTGSPTESESPSPTTSPTKSPSKSPTTSPSPTKTSPSPTKTGPRRYATCDAMNRDHPHGVGRPGARDRVRDGQKRVRNFEVNGRLYFVNAGLDTDFDGIACER